MIIVDRKKLKKMKKIQEASLFFLFVCFIIFLFYLAYHFINNQLHFGYFHFVFPAVLISSSIGVLIHLKEINKNLNK